MSNYSFHCSWLFLETKLIGITRKWKIKELKSGNKIFNKKGKKQRDIHSREKSKHHERGCARGKITVYLGKHENKNVNRAARQTE